MLVRTTDFRITRPMQNDERFIQKWSSCLLELTSDAPDIKLKSETERRTTKRSFENKRTKSVYDSITSLGNIMITVVMSI